VGDSNSEDCEGEVDRSGWSPLLEAKSVTLYNLLYWANSPSQAAAGLDSKSLVLRRGR